MMIRVRISVVGCTDDGDLRSARPGPDSGHRRPGPQAGGQVVCQRRACQRRSSAGKNYVVEFWATWCGPCKASIPHLTELQKKNPSVTFIGVSVWEPDQDKVKPFVEEMGDKMAYRVAIDLVPEKEKDNGAPWPKTG